MSKYLFFLSLSFINFYLLAKAPFPFVILHTNDLHSYLTGIGTDKGMFEAKKIKEDFKQRGHYAKLSSLIKRVKKEYKDKKIPYLLVDAGDFYSGTLFQSLGPRLESPYFPEYEFFAFHEYDGVTLGNHEFDPKDQGFFNLLQKVSKLGTPVPLISTNIIFSPRNGLEKSLIKTVVKSKIKEIIYKGRALKVGLLGALGPDGCLVSKSAREEIRFKGFDDKSSEFKWDELVSGLKEEVYQLKEKGAEVIVLLFHGGTKEDDRLAKLVPEIDVIISGHTHERYYKKVENTLIGQSGFYGQYLGVMPLEWRPSNLSFSKNKKAHFLNVKNESVDLDYLNRMKLYKRNINSLLKPTGFQFDDFIFKSDEAILRSRDIPSRLGRFVTDNVYKALVQKDKSIDFYFTSMGLIRTHIEQMDYTFSDVFKILPLGFSNKLDLGSPIVSFYLSKKEVLRLAQFLELYSKLKSKFTPTFSSNLSFKRNIWGIPFVNRIQEIKLKGAPYKDWPELVHVATNNFVAGYMDFVRQKSFGQIKLIPKNRLGIPITELIENYGPEYVYLARGLRSSESQ